MEYHEFIINKFPIGDSCVKLYDKWLDKEMWIKQIKQKASRLLFDVQ